MSVSVKGRCFSCGSTGLFVGSGGYVTCPSLDCANPTLVSDVLDNGRAFWLFVVSAGEGIERARTELVRAHRNQKHGLREDRR